MSTTHTPGPWEIVPRDAPKGTLMIASTDGLIAVMECSKTRPVTYEKAEANARLVSAAPDLLEALKRLMFMDCGEPAFIQAREAIAKAEGD